MKEQETETPPSSTWAKIWNKNGEPPDILDHHKRCPAPQNKPVFDLAHPSAWKQTAAGSHHSSEGSECPLGRVMPAWTWHTANLFLNTSQMDMGDILGGGSCSYGSVCSSTSVFKRSCVANEWGHRNSTAQSKIGLLPGVLCIFPCIYPFMPFHPPILSDLFIPTIHSSHYHVLNLLLYTC